MRLPRTPPKKGRIEIIPMIDAIFFLLVFFMFSSLSMVKMNGMKVTLPQAPAAVADTSANVHVAKDASARKIFVSLSEEGLVSVDGMALNPRDLSTSLRQRLDSKGAKLVIVQPAKVGTMQQLVTLMDALNEVTLADGSRPTVLIATDPVDHPDP